MPEPVQTLRQAFDRLPLPPPVAGTESFTVLPVPTPPPVGRIARAGSGRPCLLLATGHDQDSGRYNVELDLLSVEHQLRCAFFDTRETQLGQGTFSVLRCKTDDRTTQDYFVDVCESLIRLVGPDPTPAQITEAIQQLVRLFRAIGEPPRKTIQGLWGEVFLMEASSSPAQLVPAWHATPEDAFDFSLGPDRLEVKTTSGAMRSHVVGQNQVRPGLNVRVVLASIRVTSMAGGTSLAALLQKLKTRLQYDSHAAMVIDQQVAACLGSGMPAALKSTFDYETAKGSLRFFAAEAIPTPASIPPEVSELRFRVDLSRIEAMDQESLRQHSLAVAASPPR